MTNVTFLENFTAKDTSLAQSGLDTFAKIGVPTKKIENWHYTDLAKIIGTASFNPIMTPTSQSLNINGTIKVSIASGVPASTDVDSIEGLTIKNIDTASVGSVAQADMHAMVGINSAFYKDGINIEITKDLSQPLHLAFVNAGDSLAVMPRLFVTVSEGVKATIVETYESDNNGKQLINAVSEITIGEGATLNHYKMQDDKSDSTHISYTEANLVASSTYNQTAIFVDGKTSRNESRVNLNGSNGHVNMRGLYMAQKSQLIDNTVCVTHNAPDCTSEQLFKGILNDKAKSIFQGKIYVDRIAQKTDGYQMHRSILLSRDAEVACKPELEIYADDVKCSHGATTGEIDVQQLFYLMARGIAKPDAKRMLLNSFLVEILNDIENDEVKDFLTDVTLAKASEILG